MTRFVSGTSVFFNARNMRGPARVKQHVFHIDGHRTLLLWPVYHLKQNQIGFYGMVTDHLKTTVSNCSPCTL